MRRLLVVLLCLCLGLGSTLASTAQADDEATRAEIHAFVEEVSRESEAQNPEAVARRFDVGEMVEDTLQRGLLGRVPPRYEEAVRGAFRQQFEEYLRRPDVYGHLSEARVLRIWHRDDDRAEVYVAYGRGYGRTLRIQWQLVRKDGRWWACNLTDLDYGFPMSSLFASALRFVSENREHEDLLAAAARLYELIPVDPERDAKASLETLDELAVVPWPPVLDTVMQKMRASCLLALERPAEALGVIDELLEDAGDIAVLQRLRADALIQLGRAEEALGHVARYEALLAPDATSSLFRGGALVRLGRKDEAVEVLERGLAAAPESYELLMELMRALPDADKGRLRTHLERIEDDEALEHAIRWIGDEACGREDVASLTPVTEVLRARLPQHVYVHYYGGHLHRLASRHGEAAAAFRRAWEKAETPEEEVHFIWWYVGSMCADERPLEAWANIPDKSAGLFAIGNHLCTVNDQDGLERVLKSLREEAPAPTAHARYYEGWLAYARARYDKAFAVLQPLRRELLAAIDAGVQTDAATGASNPDLLHWIEDLLVRSLHRRERSALAMKLAREIQDRDGNSTFVVYLYVLLDDVPRAHWELIQALSAEEDLTHLLTDVDLQYFLALESHAALRALLEPAK